MAKQTNNQKQMAQKKRKLRTAAGVTLLVLAAAGVLGGIWYYRQQHPSSSSEQASSSAPDASTYEAVMQSYFSAILTGNGKAMAQLVGSSAYWTFYMENYDKTEEEIEKQLDEACATIHSEWQNTYGEDVQVSYQIVGMSQQEQEGIDEWNANMEEMLGNDGANISESVMLEVEVTYSGSITSGKETLHPTLAKIGDSWYIIEEDTTDTTE